MTPFELREWSFQNSQPDQWWLCLDAVMVEVPVTVAEIKSFLESGDYSRGRVLHISQADMAYPPWVDVTMPASLNQISTITSGESRVEGSSKGRYFGRAALVVAGLGFLFVFYSFNRIKKVRIEKERLVQEQINAQIREANLKYNREHPQPQHQAARRVYGTSPKIASRGQLVSKSQYQDSWAFTVDSGYVYSENHAAIFESGGKKYALNATARGRGYLPIDSIWRVHPESVSGMRKIDIGPFIQAALANSK
jgi:hypothetical protein